MIYLIAGQYLGGLHRTLIMFFDPFVGSDGTVSFFGGGGGSIVFS